MIAAAEDVPKHTTVARLRTTPATELAATMSLDRRPRMAEYTLNASPHTMSLAAAGTE